MVSEEYQYLDTDYPKMAKDKLDIMLSLVYPQISLYKFITFLI